MARGRGAWGWGDTFPTTKLQYHQKLARVGKIPRRMFLSERCFFMACCGPDWELCWNGCPLLRQTVRREFQRAPRGGERHPIQRQRLVHAVLLTDNEAGAEVIRITNESTGEVIRQMPSEELLGFMRNLTKMLGAFFDQSS